ncbi:MAG: proline racemase family protein [Holophagaceae bacterium]|nr:proline racemase family protein [Holophagaceae bacterium]
MRPEIKAPNDWSTITAIDAHTGGEPLRVIIDGLPEIHGKTILEKRRYMKEHYDDLRKAMMWEPRGHADMYGAIITEPVTPDGDVGVLFTHNEGYSTMCGHGVIALATVMLDLGLIEKHGDHPIINMDTPAGRVVATAHRSKGRVKSVSFINVPSFLYAMDETVDIAGLGKLKYDIAYGGAFYAFVQASDLKVGLSIENFQQLIEVGMVVKNAVMARRKIEHPFEPDLGFLYGTIIIGPPHNNSNHSRNVCIFANGELDRSPTGTGVSARAAIHFAKGEISLGEKITIESILGTCFTTCATAETTFGQHDAIIPEVSGRASIIGRNEMWIDPSDPLKYGFIFR